MVIVEVLKSKQIYVFFLVGYSKKTKKVFQNNNI